MFLLILRLLVSEDCCIYVCVLRSTLYMDFICMLGVGSRVVVYPATAFILPATLFFGQFQQKLCSLFFQLRSTPYLYFYLYL